MSDNRPPYHRRATKPLPRVRLAPVGPAPDSQREVPTLMPCPCCTPHGGQGLVPAEVYVAWMNAIISPVVSERELQAVDEDPEPPEAA